MKRHYVILWRQDYEDDEERQHWYICNSKKETEGMLCSIGKSKGKIVAVYKQPVTLCKDNQTSEIIGLNEAI